jgi:hypothetical protein
MSLTDAELFDIVEPRHPCSGTATLSLEDVQLRVQQKMQDLKLDERMASSKEAISRTWMSGSSKVRGAMESAWAGIDQYRHSHQKPNVESLAETQGSESPNGAKKESVVGSWATWAAEKRKKAFQKEEPIERPDIGPAPARPLAQWSKHSSDVSCDGVGSVPSSSDTQVEVDEKGDE